MQAEGKRKLPRRRIFPVAASISTADPQVTATLRLATWAGLKLAAVDVVNARLALMAMLPNIAGLVLMFGVALAFPRADD